MGGEGAIAQRQAHPSHDSMSGFHARFPLILLKTQLPDTGSRKTIPPKVPDRQGHDNGQKRIEWLRLLLALIQVSCGAPGYDGSTPKKMLDL